MIIRKAGRVRRMGSAVLAFVVLLVAPLAGGAAGAAVKIFDDPGIFVGEFELHNASANLPPSLRQLVVDFRDELHFYFEMTLPHDSPETPASVVHQSDGVVRMIHHASSECDVYPAPAGDRVTSLFDETPERNSASMLPRLAHPRWYSTREAFRRGEGAILHEEEGIRVVFLPNNSPNGHFYVTSDNGDGTKLVAIWADNDGDPQVTWVWRVNDVESDRQVLIDRGLITPFKQFPTPALAAKWLAGILDDVLEGGDFSEYTGQFHWRLSGSYAERQSSDALTCPICPSGYRFRISDGDPFLADGAMGILEQDGPLCDLIDVVVDQLGLGALQRVQDTPVPPGSLGTGDTAMFPRGWLIGGTAAGLSLIAVLLFMRRGRNAKG